MRIIAGSAKGKKLVTPAGQMTRPTLERHKESLFNILAPTILDTVFLDLYCGSGAIGIEALSRGSDHCHFVDNSSNAITCVKKNVAGTDFESRASVHQLDAMIALKEFINKHLTFDIIFIDPPYKMVNYDVLLNQIVSGKMLRTQGLIIVQHDSVVTLSEGLNYTLSRVKRYGKTTMSYIVGK